jgi:hypothetical protein
MPALASLNLDFNGLGFGVARGVLDSKRIICCFFRSDIDTTGVGGPDGIGLRLKPDRFGVGYPIAELH